MNMCARNLGWVALVASLALAGCAVGNTHAYHSVLADPKISGSGQVSVATHDRRPYVLSGDKQPQFVGLSRGGFGNPFDVRTDRGRPLADDMTEAIVNSLKLKGFEPVPVILSASVNPAEARERVARAGGGRGILLTLQEWKSDTMVNTALIYDLTLSVLDRAGQVIAETRLQGRDNLGGSALNPPAYAREAVPRAVKAKLEELLSDPQVASALGSSR